MDTSTGIGIDLTAMIKQQNTEAVPPYYVNVIVNDYEVIQFKVLKDETVTIEVSGVEKHEEAT